MRVFLAVMRNGSTLAASRELGMTQTTVARRIDEFEAALRLTLFERDTQGFHPTEDATALLPVAEAIGKAVAEFDAAADCRRQAQSGPIRFTTTERGMNPRNARLFAEYSKRHPGTKFEFIASEASLDLSAGEADVAVRFTPEVKDPSLICRRVGTIYWTIYASRAYAEKHALPCSMDDLDGHTLFVLPSNTMTYEGIEYVASPTDMLMALHAGRGVGILPLDIGDGDPGLVRCFPPSQDTQIPAWLLVSPAAYRRPEVRRFVVFAAPRITAILDTYARP